MNTYAGVADAYLASGYAPIPLLNGKGVTPKGSTGYRGFDVDPVRVAEWKRKYGDRGVCIRFDGLLGIDVDHYDGKNGGVHLAELEQRLGKLPPTARISSRYGPDYDGESGIRVFRLAVRHRSLESQAVWKSGPCDGVDLVRSGHRNGNVWPTMHKRGSRYGWMKEATQEVFFESLPPIEELPELPEPWVQHLLREVGVGTSPKSETSRGGRENPLPPVELTDDATWLGDCDPCPRVTAELSRAIDELGKRRHDNMIADTLSLVRLGERGHAGVGTALDRFERVFVSLVTADGSRTAVEAESEWGRSLAGAVGKVLADPTPDSEKGCCDDRPTLDATNNAVLQDRLAESLGSGPTSGVFIRGGRLVHTPHEGENGYQAVVRKQGGGIDSSAQVRPLTGLDLAALIDRNYRVVSYGAAREETRKLVSRDVCNRLVAIPDSLRSVRVLTGVSRVPFVRPDWSVCATPGYDAATGVLFLPSPGCESLVVQPTPNSDEVAEARELILRMIGEFPFNSDDDRANYLLALFAPLLVRACDALTPMILLNAHQPGSGKSLLAGILRTIFDGTVRAEFPSEKAEQEKEVAAILSASIGSVVIFDNIKGTLRSSVLEATLTARTINNRRLGTNDEHMTLVNDRVWVATGNNIAIAGDLERRTVWCSIDPGRPHPELRAGFRIPDLRAWVDENRGLIISALLTLVNAWVQGGRIRTSGQRSDDFGEVIGVVASVLQHVGIAGSVANGDIAPVAGGNDEETQWAEWFGAIWDRFQERPFTAADLLDAMADDQRGAINSRLPMAIESTRGEYKPLKAVSLGMFLRNRDRRYFGDIQVVMEKDARNGNRFTLRRYSAPRG